MSMFSSIKKAVFTPARIKKRVFDPEKMSIEDIVVPRVIDMISSDRMRDIIKEELDTYKSMEYIDAPLDQLKFNEYHTYQVGLLLKYLKEDKVYPIQNIEKVIPNFILGTSKRQLHVKVFDVVFRYVNSLKADATIQELKETLNWTPLDVSYLFYYLNLSERKLPKKK